MKGNIWMSDERRLCRFTQPRETAEMAAAQAAKMHKLYLAQQTPSDSNILFIFNAEKWRGTTDECQKDEIKFLTHRDRAMQKDKQVENRPEYDVKWSTLLHYNK